MSKRPPIPAPIVRYIQHGIDVTHYDRDPELWPPFKSPLFEVTERADGVRTTECIALPVPHGPALRRALAFGLSPAERDAIHEFLRGTDPEKRPTPPEPARGTAENLTLF